MRLLGVLVPSLALSLFSIQAPAQAVISAHSGVVHFSEGQVFIDDQPLDHKFATFPSIKEGSTLRTDKGRAEVLLTPGVFLRIDESSAIRMRANSLIDTEVEFLRGSAIVDSLDALGESHVTLIYKDTQIRFPKAGVYRLDYEPGTLQAYSGEAAVTHEGKTSSIDPAHLFFFTLDLDTKKLGDGTDDEFYDWAKERDNSISAENQVAAQSSGDVGDADNDADALAGALPNLGLPGNGLGGPGLGGSGIPNYPLPDNSFPQGSALFYPFSPYAASPYYFPYTAFPLVVIARPYRYHPGYPGRYPTWPHTTTSGTSTWTGVSHYPGISHYPIVRPAFPGPRPASAYRPYVPHAVPHPAPAPAVHAIGHR